MPDPAKPGAPGTGELDPLVHEPARLSILRLLYSVDAADFLFLQGEAGLTAGNLSSHLAKLEEAGYVQASKQYEGKRPRTVLSLTTRGRLAFRRYAKHMRALLDGPR